MINYFSNECVPGAFWLSTGSNDVIGEILSHVNEDTYQNLHALLQGESFLTYVDTSVIYPQVQKSPSTIYSFLLMAGYLKAVKVSISSAGDFMCEVALPNKEISLVYNKEILTKLEPVIPQSVAIAIQEAIFQKDEKKLKENLEKYLRETVSFFDTSIEIFHHGLVLGLCALFTGSYRVSSNRESGDGRYDIQMTPIDLSLPGFLFELKVAKGCSETELNELAQAALAQMAANHYDTELFAAGVTSIVKYGVAFCGKNVQIAIA